MLKLGLKLWSVNTDAYLREARRLYAEGVFDYLELYVVPGSQETLPIWGKLRNDLNLTFVIHAPHSLHGVNLADAANSAANAKAFDEVKRFADMLGAGKIIVHGGFCPEDGDPSAALAQLIAQLKPLADERFLIENKPYLPINNLPRRLVGSTPDEIRSVIAAVKCGFCLDIGHAVASANAHAADWRAWLADFLSLRPAMFHLSDIHVDSKIDQHLHFGTGTLPLAEVVSMLPRDANVSIETKRDSADNLNDFAKDAECLRRFP